MDSVCDEGVGAHEVGARSQAAVEGRLFSLRATDPTLTQRNHRNMVSDLVTCREARSPEMQRWDAFDDVVSPNGKDFRRMVKPPGVV